jgi:hypothetical protein
MKSIDVKFDHPGEASEPTLHTKMVGLEIADFGSTPDIWLSPVNTRGTNGKRWLMINKKDVPKVIKALKQILK